MARTTRPYWQKLSWHNARKQWKKFREGKTYYLGESGVNRSDRQAHDKALQEWEQMQVQLEHDQEAADRQALREQHKDVYKEVETARQAIADGQPHADKQAFMANLTAANEGLYQHADFRVTLPGHDQPATGSTIGHHVAQYLKLYQTQAKLGNRSINRADMLRIHLNRLLTWEHNGTPASTKPASAINAEFVENYYHHLADQLAAGQLAPGTVAPAWAVFKQFVRWLWQRDACQLPKNLDSKLLRFTVPAQEVKTWDIDHISQVLAAATPRTQLYVLLALNCGMTAKDISDLEPEQVNWSAGTITRRRSKTKSHEGVPTVTYKLWPQTLKLLKAHRATTGNKVLLSEQGSPLITQRFNDNGHLARVDCVRLALRRTLQKINNQAKRKADKAGKPAPAKIEGNFSAFRATSSTMLAHQYDEAIADYWLGHAPRGIGQRHYLAPNQKRLDQAVTWLGQVFRLGEAG